MMEVYIEHILYFLLFSGFLHIGIFKSSIYIILIPENENRCYQKNRKINNSKLQARHYFK